MIAGLWVLDVRASLLFSLSYLLLLYDTHLVREGIVQLICHREKDLLCKMDDVSDRKWVKYFVVVAIKDLHVHSLLSHYNMHRMHCTLIILYTWVEFLSPSFFLFFFALLVFYLFPTYLSIKTSKWFCSPEVSLDDLISFIRECGS